MPSPAPNTYPFDGTGQALTNRVVDETQQLSLINFRDYHFLVPDFAPFFADTLVIEYRVDGTSSFVTLDEGTDYYPALEYIGASRATAKPVYGAINFNNITLEGEIRLSYNTVGGEWTLGLDKLTEIVTNTIYNPRTTTWEQITNVPAYFPPLAHAWELSDMVGQAEILAELDAIEQAILAKDSNSDLLAHLSDFNNPHRVNKGQIGLDRVMNFSPATIAEAVAGVNPELYVTPPGLKAFFDSLGLDQVLNFVNLQEVIDQVSVPKILTWDLFLEFWKLYGGGLKNTDNNTVKPVIVVPSEGTNYTKGELFVVNTFSDGTPGTVSKNVVLSSNGVHTIPAGVNSVKITGRGAVGGVVTQPYVTLTEVLSGNGTGVFVVPAGGNALSIRARGAAGSQSSLAGTYRPTNQGSLNNVPPANPTAGNPSWTFSISSSFANGYESSGQAQNIAVSVVLSKNFSNATSILSAPVNVSLDFVSSNLSGSQLEYSKVITATFPDNTTVTCDLNATFTRVVGTDFNPGAAVTVTIGSAVRTYSGSSTLSAPILKTDNVPTSPTELTTINYSAPAGTQLEIIYQDYTANGTWSLKKYYSSRITNPVSGTNVLLEDTTGDIVVLDPVSTGQFLSTKLSVNNVPSASIPGTYTLTLVPSSSSATRRVFEYVYTVTGEAVKIRVVDEFTPNSGVVSAGASASVEILGNILVYEGSPDNNTVPGIRTNTVVLNIAQETVIVYDCPTNTNVALSYDEPNITQPISHADTVWEISTTEDFTLATNVEGTGFGKGASFNLTQWKPTLDVLINNTNYFVRVKWIRSDGTESDWSDSREFRFVSGVSFPPRDTEQGKFCKGVDQWGTYADGIGGSYEKLIQTNSSACGYTPPVIPEGVTATGGQVSDIEHNGLRFRLHIFYDNGAFNVSKLGTLGNVAEYLLIGGGGPGSSNPGNLPVNGAGACGGGGNGEYIPGTTTLRVFNYPIIVGRGGTYVNADSRGEQSSFDGIVARGGQRGGTYNGAGVLGNGGSDWGSGGGAGQAGTGQTKTGGTPLGQNTFPGGHCVIPAGKSTGGGGGGGGAGGPGGNAFGNISVINGGNGGVGITSEITGTPVTRAAGGGGAASNASSGSGTGAGVPGTGGIGGGGNGAGYNAAYSTPGVNGTGSGGGGGNGANRPGARGGDGVFIIRYRIP